MRSPVSSALLLLAACGNQIVNPNPDDKTTGDDTASGPGSIAFSIEAIEFGAMHFGDHDNAAITVYNRGAGPLEVTEVLVAGTDSPFTVTPLHFDVDPGASTTVTVSVSAGAYGDFPDEIHFASNDVDNPDAVVTVHASTISDEDGDGHDVLAAGGDDCDDDDAAAHPGAEEEWYNGQDENCDGVDDYDQDADGFRAAAYEPDPEQGGGDCQDINAEYYPGAADEPYDNRDTNCDGADDFDYDGDGSRSADYGSGTDCDDYDATVNAEGQETFNAKDDDCNGIVDDDAAAYLAPYVYDAGGTRDQMGFSVALGDLDSDGFAEVVAAGPYVDAPRPSAAGSGGVGVFMGGASLPATGTDLDHADSYVEGDTTDDLLGYSVTVLRDYTGDGFPDLIVGSPGVSSGAGVLYVFDGNEIDRVTDTSRATLEIQGGTANAVGRGLGGELDLDADGLSDLTFCYSSGVNNYLGVSYGGSIATSGPHTDATLYSTDGGGTAFYRNAPVGGDFDGDGYDDLLVADGLADYGSYTNNGALWAIWGSGGRPATGNPVDLETVATVLYSGAANDASDAWAVELAPDWDGDGDDELWVYNSGEGLYVVEGGPGRTTPFDVATEAVVYYDWHANSTDVDHLDQAGDWTGDGLVDILAFQTDQDGSYGDVDLFSSELQSGVHAQRDARVAHIVGSSTGDNGNAGYGISAVGADVDGDGDDDVAMGDPAARTSAGEAYLFLNGIIP